MTTTDTEGWQSGRMRRTRNPVYGYTVSWVQIPPLPPQPLDLWGFQAIRANFVPFFVPLLNGSNCSDPSL